MNCRVCRESEARKQPSHLKGDAPEGLLAQRAGAGSHLEAGCDAGLDAVPHPVQRVGV